GQQIASGSYDNTMRLWDAQTGAPGAILGGHADYVRSVVFSPSGQQIASGSEDSTVRLWDAKSGECLAVVQGFCGAIQSIAWNTSNNGSYFATGCEDKSIPKRFKLGLMTPSAMADPIAGSMDGTMHVDMGLVPANSSNHAAASAKTAPGVGPCQFSTLCILFTSPARVYGMTTVL
ncbi:hypothetical protein BGX28_000755, partial [Mortierella sp. GBA30]